jgi:hypothetical protein
VQPPRNYKMESSTLLFLLNSSSCNHGQCPIGLYMWLYIDSSTWDIYLLSTYAFIETHYVLLSPGIAKEHSLVHRIEFAGEKQKFNTAQLVLISAGQNISNAKSPWAEMLKKTKMKGV